MPPPHSDRATSDAGYKEEQLPQIGARRRYVEIVAVVAMLVRGEGLVALKSRAAHESDCATALLVATFLMDREPEQAC